MGSTRDWRRFLAGEELPARRLNRVVKDSVGLLLDMFEEAETSLDAGLISRLVALSQHVHDAVPDDWWVRPRIRSLAGSARLLRFECAGDPADLDAAMTLLESGIGLLPEDDEVYPDVLRMCGMARLDQAITMALRAAGLV